MATSVEGMSRDQLKEHLYHNLQGRGVLDSMKSQLRNRLATELQKSVPTSMNGPSKSSRRKRPHSTSSKHHRPRSPDSQSTSLSHHVAFSIVAEYLNKAGFEYSLSVFIPEAKVSIDKLYTVEDLIQYLRIPPSSPLYITLQSSQHKTGGLLVQLLEALLENSSSLHTCHNDQNGESTQISSSGIQGAGSSSPVQAGSRGSSRRSRRSTVDEQLKVLDQSYAQKAEQHSVRCQQNLEERLSAFQRELEAQYKNQLETELSLYRTRELAKMRLEEREKYQEDLTKEKMEMVQNHQKKIDELRKSEVQMLERFRKKEQDLQAGIHLQRQALLDEMSALKVRESELRRQSELNKRAACLEEERVKAMVEQLDGKEKALQHMKEHYDKMAEDKAQKYKLEFESQLQLKQSELSKWESELKMDREKMASLNSETQRLNTELQVERGKSERLQSLLQEATGRQITLQGQKDALQQKVDQMDNYQQRSNNLQQEVATIEKKLLETKTEYKRRISVQQHLIKDLQSKMSHPRSNLEVLQREVEQLRNTHQKEVLVMEYDNKELTRQLAVQTEYAHRLQDRLDEQLVQLMSAQREVQDVHSLLEHLKPAVPRGRGGGNTSRKPGATTHRATNTGNKQVPIVSKPSTYRSTILHPSRHHTPTLHFPHTSHLHNTTSLQEDALLIAASDLGNGPTTQGVSFSDASSQLLAETRATFARLEKDAEELEDTYHQFHRKNNMRPDLSYSESLGCTNDRGNDNFPLTPLSNKYQGPPSELVADPTPSTLVQYTPGLFTFQSSTLSPNKATVSRPESHIVRPLPLSHQSTTVAPPPTTTVWTVSTAMTAKASPPLMQLPPSNVHIPTAYDHTTRQLFAYPSMSPSDKSISEQPLISKQSPVLLTSSSHPSTVVPTMGFAVTQQPEGQSLSNQEVLSTARNVVNTTSSTNVKTTDIESPHPHSNVASSANSKRTQSPPAISAQPLAPSLVTKTSPPRISLDELWKSSQHQRQSDADRPAPESKDRYLELSNRTQQPKVRENEENEKKKEVEKDALPRQDTEASTDPSLNSSNEHKRPSSPLQTNLGHCEGGLDKEQVHSAEENDPVMLKYMELVKQRRENKTSQVGSQKTPDTIGDEGSGNSKLDNDFGIPSLSQASENFSGFSDKEDGLFDDW